MGYCAMCEDIIAKEEQSVQVVAQDDRLIRICANCIDRIEQWPVSEKYCNYEGFYCSTCGSSSPRYLYQGKHTSLCSLCAPRFKYMLYNQLQQALG